MAEDIVRLVQPRTCFVEHLTHSGYTKLAGAEFFVFYEDHDKTSMLVRVLETHPTCRLAEVGKVYVTKVYRDQEFVHDGERFRILDERFLEAEIEGYDDRADEIAEDHEADGFPVCRKA